MLWLTGVAVDLMACPAGPALDRLVHMYKMKILLAVPESCRGNGVSSGERLIIVTHDAEGVFPLGIGNVEIRGVIVHQDPIKIRSVRIMAGGTISTLDRPVNVLVCLEIGFHIRDLAVAFRHQLTVVTFKTKVHLGKDQELRLISEVGFVAVSAGLGVVHGTMLRNRLLNECGLIRMARRAQPWHRRRQQRLVCRTMLVMTEDAGLFDREMSDLSGLQTFLFIWVALKAERISIRIQPSAEIALVVVMASRAVPTGNRRMHDLIVHHTVGMTLKTELRDDLFEHALVRRSMWIVAGRAIAALDGGVNDFLRVLRLVTLVAHVGLGRDQHGLIGRTVLVVTLDT